MPLRRRRDGTAVQARTEEPSSARVRVPARQKAPWSFRRCLPSRGGIKEGPRPVRTVTRSSRPLSPLEPATRVPEAPREGHARHRPRARGSPFLERFGPRFALVHESGTRRAQAGGCRSRLAAPRCGNVSRGNATGIGWCQRVAGRKPHSRARIGRSLGVLARRFRLQKSTSDTEAQRSVSPVGNGARGRGPSSRGFARTRGGAKASRTGVAVAKPRTRESPEPGAREGVAGQGVSLDGRHLGLLVRPASFTRSGRGRSRRLPRVRRSRERQAASGGGDRDARGTDRTHRDGKTTPTAVTPRQTCGPPKRIALM